MSRRTFIACFVLGAAIGIPRMAHAQPNVTVDSPFQLSYFDNNSAADATVRITNTGARGGDLCAMIYVFAPDQQLSECCGCRVTPNGLLKLSVQNNLTNNTLTGVCLEAGTIKILGTAPVGTGAPAGSSPGCDPGIPGAISSGLLAWGTHNQDSGYVTETPFLPGTLSAGELARISSQCTLIEGNSTAGLQGLGSGQGLCDCTSLLGGSD